MHTTDPVLPGARQLIAIPSTADNPAALQAAVDFIAERVDQTPGITLEHFMRNDKPSFLAYRTQHDPHRQQFDILLNGHVDVVAAHPKQFKAIVREGRLYGRGALDMKVTALVLADLFCELATTSPYTIGLQIVSDEEVGGVDGTAHQLAQGVTTSMAIAGESTPAHSLNLESRGICWVEAEFRGTAAHSAYPWDGDNAVLQASRFAGKLLQDYSVPHEAVWRTTANISAIHTPHTTFNRVPDTATLSADIRFVAPDPHFASREAALQYLTALDPHATIRIVNYDPGHRTDPADPFVERLAASLQKISGKPTHFIRKHGAADVRHFSARGIPAVVYGLSGEDPHGDHEYVELASIETYRRVLRDFLQRKP